MWTRTVYSSIHVQNISRSGVNVGGASIPMEARDWIRSEQLPSRTLQNSAVEKRVIDFIRCGQKYHIYLRKKELHYQCYITAGTVSSPASEYK